MITLNKRRWGSTGRTWIRGARQRLDERGAVAIVVAGLFVVLCGAAAGVIDCGSLYLVRHRLQAAADASATAATFDLTRATAIVAASVASNGVSLSAPAATTIGTYTGNPALAPADRFAVGGTSPNAIRVGLTEQAPTYLLGLFTGRHSLPVAVQATAASIAEGSFSAGTGVASLDGGVLNGLLSGLLGTSVSLSLLNYQALAETNVSLLSFSNALASQIGITSGTYETLLASSVSLGDIVAAAQSATGGTNPQATAALAALGDLSASGSFPLSNLLDLGDWDQRQIGSLNASAESSFGVNLLDLVMLGSQLPLAGHAIALSLPLSIPGIATANVLLTIGEGAQSAPRIGLGPVGISVHTAQVRLYLLLSLLPLPGLSAATVQLPLYLEAAPGTATLTAITCASDPQNDAAMTIAAVPGLADASIGSVTASQMTNFTTSVSPAPATVLNLAGLVTATAGATATLQSPEPDDVTFTAEDIADGTVQTVDTQDFMASLLSGLSTSLGQPGGLTVSVLGILPLPIGTLASTLTTSLQGVLSSLDPVLNGLLLSLGVEVGTMDLRATGVRCGVPVLVQ